MKPKLNVTGRIVLELEGDPADGAPVFAELKALVDRPDSPVVRVSRDEVSGGSGRQVEQYPPPPED